MEGDAIKLEQLETLFTQLGLEKTDLDQISSTEVTDFSPYVDKVKSNIKDVLLTDTKWMDSIKEPIIGEIIGKEKQLKKDVNREYDLHFSEAELTKMPFKELLAKAKETHKTGIAGDAEKYKKEVSEWMEKYEALDQSIPEKLTALENGYKAKLQQKDIREELYTIAASEAQVPKENITFFTTAFLGFVNELGFKLNIDDKKALSLKDSEGLPAKKEDGTILRVKELVKEFSNKMNVNIAPKGDANKSQNGQVSNDLMQILGVGIQ